MINRGFLCASIKMQFLILHENLRESCLLHFSFSVFTTVVFRLSYPCNHLNLLENILVKIMFPN